MSLEPTAGTVIEYQLRRKVEHGSVYSIRPSICVLQLSQYTRPRDSTHIYRYRYVLGFEIPIPMLRHSIRVRLGTLQNSILISSLRN